MWLSSKIVGMFEISKDAVTSLREELAAVKAERDTLQRQLSVTQVNFDWIRLQINSLQFERTGLLEKAYGIKVPSPELVRTPSIGDGNKLDFSFEDVGEEMARKYGLPAYIDKQ